METNFENTYGKKLNTINKMTYAKMATLQASTTCHESKSKRRQMLRESHRRGDMLNKTTMASINSAQHTQHMEGTEHRKKKRKKTDYLFSGQCGTFTTSRRFRQRYCSHASGF